VRFLSEACLGTVDPLLGEETGDHLSVCGAHVLRDRQSISSISPLLSPTSLRQMF